jgi:serine/threonine protein kinase
MNMNQEITGRIIQQYRVEELIGSGEMGKVYKVFDLDRNVHLAMKVLQDDLVKDSVFVKLFKEEGKIHEQLKHNHIVKYYGFFQKEERYFTLQDFIKGSNLQNIIRKRKGVQFRIEEIIRYYDPLCRALSYAHSKDIIHCDVKPGNILINQNKSIFLTDFGISSMGIQYQSNLFGIGSPIYMAPEQISRDFGVLSPRTDVYSLGVLLYLMVSGILPFNGNRAPSYNKRLDVKKRQEFVKWEHCNIEPIPLHRINPEIPSEMVHLINQCLRKDPHDRIRDTSLLLRELLAIWKTEKKKTNQSARPPITDDSNREKITKFFRKWNWYIIIGSIAIFLILFSFVIYNSTSSDQVMSGSYLSFDETTPLNVSSIIPVTNTPIPTQTLISDTNTPISTQIIDLGTNLPIPTQIIDSETKIPIVTPFVIENKKINTISCMTIQLEFQNLVEECVTGITIQNNGELLIDFSWKAVLKVYNTVDPYLTVTPPFFEVEVYPDVSNSIYITDNFSNIYFYISKGGAANKEFTLKDQQVVSGWYLFPPIGDQVDYIVFHDDDNFVKTDPIYLK